MESKNCSMCETETQIKEFYKKYTECKYCNSKKGLKRYYENKDKISNQRKIYYKKIKKNYYRNKLIEIYNLKK